MKNLIIVALVLGCLYRGALSTGSGSDWKPLTSEEFFQHEWNQVVLNEAKKAVEASTDLGEFQFQKLESSSFKFHEGMKLKLGLQYADPEGVQRHFDVELFSQPWNKLIVVQAVEEVQTLKSFKLSSFQKGPGLQLKGENLLDDIINPFSKFVNVTEPQWKKVPAVNDQQPLVVAQQAVSQKYNPEADSFVFDQVVSVRQNVAAFNYVLSYVNGAEVRLYEVLVAESPESGVYQPLLCYFITQLGGGVKGVPSGLNGGYKVKRPSAFMQQNSNVLPVALQAIDSQYDPEASGFEFDNLLLVQEQVVAGMNFKLTLEYSNGDGQIQIYEVVVYDIPWQNSVTVTSCKEVGQYSTKPQIQTNIYGGWTSVNPQQFQQSNSDAISVANQAVESKYNPSSQGFYFANVVSVKEQVVSGTNYAMELQYSNEQGDSEYFNVVIYDCPWENNSMTVVSCDEVYPGTTMAAYETTSGGWTSVSPSQFTQANSNVIGVAQNAVDEQYNPEESGYEFVKVTSVKQQVVAGVNYDIVLEYENSSGQKQFFDVVVYDVPWTNSIQVTSCTQMAQPPALPWLQTTHIPEAVFLQAKQTIIQKFKDNSFKNVTEAKQQGTSNYQLWMKFQEAQYIVLSYQNEKQGQSVLCFKTKTEQLIN